MTSLEERTTTIEELTRTSKDLHKADECQVVAIFIEYHNNTYGTDYILSKNQPLSTDDPVDVLINSKSDPKKSLKIQVKTFDPRFREAINKNDKQEYLRVINKNEQHPLIKDVEKIIDKLDSLGKKTKEGLTILLDGFWGFDLREKLAGDLRNLFIGKKFKEVWIVYSQKNCIKLL